MSWGTELWDQYDNIAKHTSNGIDFLENYGRFVDQRCKIEQEYASKLRRLVRAYLPKTKKDEDEYQFTCTNAYKNLLNELGDQAGQHEVIAENLSTSVVLELTKLVKELKDDRRKYMAEGQRIKADLQSSLRQLSITQEKYHKAFGASERALDAYHKADADINLSRAEVEKQRVNNNNKNQQFEDAKNEYASQLQKTNEAQAKYYDHFQPQVMQNFQDLDERRIKYIRNFILTSVNIERDVLPIINQCLDEMAKNADNVNESEDTRLIVEKFKSGFSPPGDIPFKDLSHNPEERGGGGADADADNQSIKGSLVSVQVEGITKKPTLLGTITGTRAFGGRKRSGIMGLFHASKDDFSDLPPNQRRKRLQGKVEDITGKICQETAARDGLMKMKQVYESNPALGDPMSIQGQLTDNEQRLTKLQSEKKKFQEYLDEMDSPAGGMDGLVGRVSQLSVKRNSNAAIETMKHDHHHHHPGGAVSAGGGGGGVDAKSSSRRRSSVSDGADSLSRSASDSSVSNNPAAAAAAAAGKQGSATNAASSNGAQGTSNSPAESGFSSSSLATSEYESRTSSADGGSAYNSRGSGRYQQQDASSNHPVDVDDPDADDEFFDPEPLPILGRCKAMYPFEVTSEGSIRMEEGEELWLIENDAGDGWTRVRRINIAPSDPMPEGFVPSSYIEILEQFATPMASAP